MTRTGDRSRSGAQSSAPAWASPSVVGGARPSGGRRAPVKQRRRDRRLIEGSSEFDPGRLRQANERRRRQAGDVRGHGQRGPRGIERDRAAAVEDERPIHPPEHARIVLRTQDRRTRERQVRDEVGHRDRPGRVELGRRLVEDEDGRPHRDDARDRDPLLLAARQGEWLAVGEVRDAEAIERRVDAGVHLRSRDAQVLQSEGQFLAHGQLRGGQLVGRRREHDADPAEQLAGRRRGGGDAVDLDPTVELRTTRGMNPAAARASVDLPAPVRPATPTRSPAATATEMSSRLGSFLPGYRINSSWIRSGGAAGIDPPVIATRRSRR